MSKLIEGQDYYYDRKGRMVLTELFHIKRGTCCGNGCLMCPYTPQHIRGTSKIKDKNE